ncbi:heterodisulfide reductase-related iron-sulfur binding cluster [Anoxynatronum sibiricum]|uniref:Heterodisulfide reductase-related iron-sulfur binding cluster n=1 Tax=Anoxynatronum sibiricum TaxID=210623 RepID=A0ABU9VTE3_9CLOT
MSFSNAPVTCHVQDSCATRQYPEVQQSARHLMTRLGVNPVKVNESDGRTLCCGQGELMGSSVNEPVSFLRKRASRFHKHPVMTYCAGCQEAVHRGGQSSYHLLDLIFPKETGNTFPVSLSPASLLTKWKNRRLFMTEAALITGKQQQCLPSFSGMVKIQGATHHCPVSTAAFRNTSSHKRE